MRTSQLLPDLSEGKSPCPLKYDECLPMIAVRQEGIKAIVQGGINVTGSSLCALLSTRERISLFNYGGEAIRGYLDASLTPPRGNA